MPYPWNRLRRRRVRALWALEAGHRRSLLLGAPHFFPVSYKPFLHSLIQGVKRVVFEGNVEPFHPDVGAREESLMDFLDQETVRKVKQEVGVVLCTDFARVDTGELIYSQAKSLEPWAGFLTIWLGYLEKKGWKHSMEADALEMARAMGKEVHFLESREEQLAALRKMPPDRIKRFLGMAEEWEAMLRGFREMYELGDVEKALDCMRHFPTRCEEIIDRRDDRLTERMLPILREGDALFLLGTAHCPGLIARLRSRGIKVRRNDL
jgi:hypothetical protein